MIFNQQHEPPVPGYTDSEVVPPALTMHPHIFLRMTLVTAERVRTTLVVELDKLIINLERMSQFDDRFSIHAATMRAHRDQVALADIQSPDKLSVIKQIDRILPGIVASLKPT